MFNTKFFKVLCGVLFVGVFAIAAASRVLDVDSFRSSDRTKTWALPAATDTLVGRASTDTLTNKTLSGNTATNLISGSGTLTLNTSGTVTAPNATDTLVGKATTDTLTNKSISGSTNTITNVSLTAGVTGTLPIANGGTEKALTLSAGGVPYFDADSFEVLAAGSSGQVLTSGGAGAPTWTSPLVNPMDAAGQLIYGGASGVATKLAAGTAGQILISAGAAAPVWSASWYVNAYTDGASPSLGTANVASYTEIINGSLTLTPISGSAAVGVMCSTTNAATAPSTSATTCAAGSESLGINFEIPTIGAYEVCAAFGHAVDANTGGFAVVGFQLIETPTNAQTLTLESGTRTSSGCQAEAIASGANAVCITSNRICGVFTWAATGTKGIRLMYEQLVGATLNSSSIQADASTSVGQRNVGWSVKRLF